MKYISLLIKSYITSRIYDELFQFIVKKLEIPF